MAWDDLMNLEQKAAYDEIMTKVPGLMYERDRLLLQRLEPTGVLLPARVNKPFAGAPSTTAKATLFGLPITWSKSEEWGLILHLPLAKEAEDLDRGANFRQY